MVCCVLLYCVVLCCVLLRGAALCFAMLCGSVWGLWYCRLRCLLYDEEMDILDSSLSVLRDLENGEVTYRYECHLK